MQQRVPGAPSSWLAYVEVDDIAAATQTAKSLGAKITMDVMELPGIGSMSMFIDPTGAALALWKPAAPGGPTEGGDKPPRSKRAAVLWSAGACSRFRNPRRRIAHTEWVYSGTQTQKHSVVNYLSGII